MRVLVTGCSAFVGDAVRRALERRRFRVSPTAARAREGVAALDVLDPAAVSGAIAAHDAVIHLAAIRAYGERSSIERATQVIIEGTRNVLCAAAARDVPVVCAGSAEEYGPEAPVPYREDGPRAPRSEYGRAKRDATDLALTTRGARAAVLRPSTVYGPGQPSMMFVASCVRAALEDAAVTLNGGEQLRDHVFVDDVGEAFARALERHDAIVGQCVNVASGEATSVRSMAERILQRARRGRLVLGPASSRPGDVLEMRFSTERAERWLEWRATTTLEEGVERTLAAVGLATASD